MQASEQLQYVSNRLNHGLAIRQAGILVVYLSLRICNPSVGGKPTHAMTQMQSGIRLWAELSRYILCDPRPVTIPRLGGLDRPLPMTFRSKQDKGENLVLVTPATAIWGTVWNNPEPQSGSASPSPSLLLAHGDACAAPARCLPIASSSTVWLFPSVPIAPQLLVSLLTVRILGIS